MTFGKELVKSAHEALVIARGETKPAGVYVPGLVDVAAMRKKQRLSQKAFADRYGLSVDTVRDWEQESRLPDRTALVLLSVIDHEPEAVMRALAKEKFNISSGDSVSSKK